jgi:hypothetical protein
MSINRKPATNAALGEPGHRTFATWFSADSDHLTISTRTASAVDAHRGRIGVEDNQPKGSLFNTDNYADITLEGIHVIARPDNIHESPDPNFRVRPSRLGYAVPT